jgi:type III secretion protein J
MHSTISPTPAHRVHGAQRVWQILLLGVLLLTLAGCKEAVYSHMTEVEANDALYTLLQGGVAAEKHADPDAGFSVWADRNELAKAIGLLKANAQPEEKHPSLGELFGRNQLISTPVEERVRFVYGMEQALAQTLSKIDGVLVARVHIVLPVNDPLASELKPSSASVFIKHQAGVDMAASVPAIKDLVVRSIEALTVDRVAVTLFAAGGARPATVDADSAAALAGGSRFLGMPVPAASVSGLWLRLVVVMAVVALLLGFALRKMSNGGGARIGTAQAPAVPARAARPSQAQG